MGGVLCVHVSAIETSKPYSIAFLKIEGLALFRNAVILYHRAAKSPAFTRIHLRRIFDTRNVQ